MGAYTAPLFMGNILEIIENHIVRRLSSKGIATDCHSPNGSNYLSQPSPIRIIYVVHTTTNFKIFDDHVSNGLEKYSFEDPESIDRLNYDLDIIAEALLDFRR